MGSHSLLQEKLPQDRIRVSHFVSRLYCLSHQGDSSHYLTTKKKKCQNRRAQFHPWVEKIVQFICSVLSNWLSYPSLTPRACSNKCPPNWWCYLMVFPNVVPFSSHVQSFPAPEKSPGKCIHDYENHTGQRPSNFTDQSTWPAPWETCMQVKKQQLEPDIETQTGSKFGKEYLKAAYCHPAYLSWMPSTSCKMPCWMKHKLESTVRGVASITSNMQMT